MNSSKNITDLLNQVVQIVRDDCAEYKDLATIALGRNKSTKDSESFDLNVLREATAKLNAMVNELEIYRDGIEQIADFLREQSLEVQSEIEDFEEGRSFAKKQSDFSTRAHSFRQTEEAGSLTGENGVISYDTGCSSWADDFERQKSLEKMKNKIWNFDRTMHFKNKTINNYRNIDLGFGFKVPVVSSLDHIPECMYYCSNGDKSGIYICLTKGTYVRVPLPDVTIAALPEKVQRCKYLSTDDCQRRSGSSGSSENDVSNLLNKLRMKTKCNKVHSGGTYIKTKFPGRCDELPEFGNKNTLRNDWGKVPLQDIKMMLMYSLSDMFLAACWFQKSELKITMEDIDKNV